VRLQILPFISKRQTRPQNLPLALEEHSTDVLVNLNSLPSSESSAGERSQCVARAIARLSEYRGAVQ
jgi:hypothetical protein